MKLSSRRNTERPLNDCSDSGAVHDDFCTWG